MRVVVTRAAQDAQRWKSALQTALRHTRADVVTLPLIEILPVADRAPIDDAWRRLAGWHAAMFVSANAVEHFFKGKTAVGRSGTAWDAIKTRAWATGPGTRDALLRAGVAASHIDAPPLDAAQFDSEALWRVAGAGVQPGDRVLVVRGADALGRSAGRNWLAQQLAAAGAHADFLPVYERHAPRLDAHQQVMAHTAVADGSVWLFSSSEAVANLRQALPGAGLDAARAVATHPRIAQAARDAGFGVVCESRPALADVAASIESFA